MVSSRRDVSCWSIVLQNILGPGAKNIFSKSGCPFLAIRRMPTTFATQSAIFGLGALQHVLFDQLVGTAK
jgi:hypothetical protein